MKPHGPNDVTLATILSLPDGVVLRAVRGDELSTVPGLLREWFPTVEAGAESVFLEDEWLQRNVATMEDDRRDVRVLWVERAGERVGLMSFERQLASQTLHGRVGALAPQERTGVLGALGFPVFEALGRWLEAELLLVWVTLSSRTQQVMAERRGFLLCGLVPEFDHDQVSAGVSVRVMEALSAKVLAPGGALCWPDATALTAKTWAALEALRLSVTE